MNVSYCKYCSNSIYYTFYHFKRPLYNEKSHKNKLLQCQSATLERSGVLVKSKLLGFEIAL